MIRAFQFIFGLFLCGAAIAGPTNPPITKIVYRLSGPQIPVNSFGTRPTALYIGGETYSRVEEASDPGRGRLVIINVPDIWRIFDDQGEHLVDTGLTSAVHHCIVDRGRPKACLEYGKEIAFFQMHHAVSLGTRELENRRCNVAELKDESSRMVLYTTADTDTPFQLEIYRDGKLDLIVHYISHQTGLPFDASLFKPPANVHIVEAQ